MTKLEVVAKYRRLGITIEEVIREDRVYVSAHASGHAESRLEELEEAQNEYLHAEDYD